MKVFIIDFPSYQAVVCGYDTAQDARQAAENANSEGVRSVSAQEITEPTVIFREIDTEDDINGIDVEEQE